MLDEAAFESRVAAAFKRLVAALDRADPDAVDADNTSEMVTITGGKSGLKVVINTQRAVRQLWVAGNGQGIHFSWDPGKGQWLDDKGKGLELLAWVTECVFLATGERIAP